MKIKIDCSRKPTSLWETYYF